MTPQEFLRSKNMLGQDSDSFFIHYEDGRTVDLCKILEEYKNL